MPVREMTPEEKNEIFGNGLVLFGQKPPEKFLQNFKKRVSELNNETSEPNSTTPPSKTP